MKILVVDSSSSARQEIRRQLERAGYDVLESTTSEGALDALHKENIALVTIDPEMADGLGLELCQEIRRLGFEGDAAGYVPVVFLSNNDRLETRLKAFEVGATEYLLQSEIHLSLREVVDRHLRPRHMFENMLVYIAQDGQEQTQSMVEALSVLGVKTLSCCDGLKAYNDILLNKEKIDLVLLDNIMPGMYGFEVLWRIRRDLGLRELPVIVICENDRPADRLEFFRAGANDCLEKPFLREELIARVRLNLQLRYHAKARAGMIRELERSNQALKEFAFVAAHDLRAPLLAVCWCAELLEQEDLSGFSRGLVGKLIAGGRRMEKLIDSLLEHSRIGGGEGDFVEVDLSNILNEVMVDLQSQIADRQAVIIVDKLPIVRGDSTHLRRLFQNLVGNALKYQAKGNLPRVNVSSKLVEIEDNGHMQKFFHITVQDNGIGFDNERKGEIFSLFSRLVSSAEYEGNGIGLATCRSIVQNHGGKISCESEPGRGSKFFVLFPVVATPTIDNSETLLLPENSLA